jgi:hypothetical protein
MTQPGDWKTTLKSKLRSTLHERTPAFEGLMDQYMKSGPAEGKKYLNPLIGGCMALPEPEVLKEILAMRPWRACIWRVRSTCRDGKP